MFTLLITSLTASFLFPFIFHKPKYNFISPKPAQIKQIKLGGIDISSTLKADINLNNSVANIVNIVKIAQSNYINSYPLYFQGLKTHTVIPTYGFSTFPDNLNTKPFYESLGWNFFLPSINASLPFQVEIHQYQTEKDKGYQIYFRVQSGGIIYVKSVGVGSQAVIRTFDWQIQDK